MMKKIRSVAARQTYGIIFRFIVQFFPCLKWWSVLNWLQL